MRVGTARGVVLAVLFAGAVLAAGRPVVVCVSRLVPRKGQDALIRALPAIRAQVPGVALLLVSSGPYEQGLRRLARRSGVAQDVIFTGAVAEDELPAHFAAGDVFAMPRRTRRGGADVDQNDIGDLRKGGVERDLVVPPRHFLREEVLDVGVDGKVPRCVNSGQGGENEPNRDDAAKVRDAVTCRLTDPR